MKRSNEASRTGWAGTRSLLGYERMPSHWHPVLRPEAEGEMSCFRRWVTATHTMRYYAHHHTSGDGHLYQGRCKSLPIQDDGHFVTVCRYVERVHQPLAESELAAVRRCVPRETPFGEPDGRDAAADRLGLAAFLPGLQPTPRVRASGVLSFPPATRRLATSRPSLRILWPFRARRPTRLRPFLCPKLCLSV